MRILLAGPDYPHGSLPPYLDVLADALRRHGAYVDRLGSPGVPHDLTAGRFWSAADIVTAADRLADHVDPVGYDVISLHAGNLEIEQLLPDRWQRRGVALPPVVVHVHALDQTLFSVHVPDPDLRAAADRAITAAAGLVYFGQYARTALTRRLPAAGAVPSTVVPLPTTIPRGTRAQASPALSAALHDRRPDATLLSLCGYAAPWKSPAGLIAALERTTAPIRVVLAGPFWDDPDGTDTDLRPFVASPVRLGRAAELVVVAEYVDPAGRAALMANSTCGVFPYQHQPTFQGSGAIGDYLAHGVPVIATDVANMAELIGDAGWIVPPAEPGALAAAIDRIALDQRRRRALTTAAAALADRFTPAGHAARCLDFYLTVAGHHRAPSARR